MVFVVIALNSRAPSTGQQLQGWSLVYNDIYCSSWQFLCIHAILSLDSNPILRYNAVDHRYYYNAIHEALTFASLSSILFAYGYDTERVRAYVRERVGWFETVWISRNTFCFFSHGLFCRSYGATARWWWRLRYDARWRYNSNTNSRASSRGYCLLLLHPLRTARVLVLVLLRRLPLDLQPPRAGLRQVRRNPTHIPLPSVFVIIS